ncbi:hypothetical protein C7449_10141 [Mycoplana dimorpha]|uniref:Uncharacterized protein n=1 Tax=Mycoplana dimorpha TaxID=28320 RepID=A0A2T5BHG5_MYCDI|nr:hypothetical protein C7449_10141 [Mycoplana dimorpha]
MSAEEARFEALLLSMIPDIPGERVSGCNFFAGNS